MSKEIFEEFLSAAQEELKVAIITNPVPAPKDIEELTSGTRLQEVSNIVVVAMEKVLLIIAHIAADIKPSHEIPSNAFVAPVRHFSNEVLDGLEIPIDDPLRQKILSDDVTLHLAYLANYLVREGRYIKSMGEVGGGMRLSKTLLQGNTNKRPKNLFSALFGS